MKVEQTRRNPFITIREHWEWKEPLGQKFWLLESQMLLVQGSLLSGSRHKAHTGMIRENLGRFSTNTTPFC